MVRGNFFRFLVFSVFLTIIFSSASCKFCLIEKVFLPPAIFASEAKISIYQHERALDKLEEQMEMYGRFKVVEKTWVELDGRVYGAQPDGRGPIGGGEGYDDIVTSGDYTAPDLDELISALGEAGPGEIIFIPEGAAIDVSSRVYIENFVLEIPAGVTLAGNRGENGSPGALIFSDAFRTYPLLRAGGRNVRVTGLRMRGPDPRQRKYHARQHRSADYGYYDFPINAGISTSYPELRVDNCELAGWSHAAIRLEKGGGHHIHHNYIHHNQRQGLGYGVSLNTAEALIERNLFDFNRHSIAATGRPGSGYEAKHNVELGDASSHPFDMHGGHDRGDGTDTAGAWVKILNNAFFNDAARIPVVIRGIPEESALVRGNWFPNHNPRVGLHRHPEQGYGPGDSVRFCFADDSGADLRDRNAVVEDNLSGRSPGVVF